MCLSYLSNFTAINESQWDTAEFGWDFPTNGVLFFFSFLLFLPNKGMWEMIPANCCIFTSTTGKVPCIRGWCRNTKESRVSGDSGALPPTWHFLYYLPLDKRQPWNLEVLVIRILILGAVHKSNSFYAVPISSPYQFSRERYWIRNKQKYRHKRAKFRV